MTLFYVHRDRSGKIDSAYAVPAGAPLAMPEYDATPLDDTVAADLRAFLVPAKPTVISAADFLNRFTAGEQIAVQQTALVNPQVALGLTMGLARTTIDLHGPLLGPWMATLVAVGALTQQRATEISTP